MKMTMAVLATLMTILPWTIEAGQADKSATPASSFGFRGLALGMSLSEFKRSDAPLDTAGIKLSCTPPDNGEGAASPPIRCVWLKTGADGRNHLSPIAFGNVTTKDYGFLFVRKGGEREPRLSQILLVTTVEARARMLRRLKEKYGSPAQPYVDDDNMIVLWDNGPSQIELRSSVVDGEVHVRFLLK